MKERPILFNGEMVRAILDGRKTQTRRVVKWPVLSASDGAKRRVYRDGDIAEMNEMLETRQRHPNHKCCPYGQPGDRLWVRETWAPHAEMPGAAIYRCDPGGDYQDTVSQNFRWHPSIHMPRWASRLTLEIAGVRVERLQDISEEDAKAEGVESGIWDRESGLFAGGVDPEDEERLSFRDGFGFLWELLYGPGSWDANPWVWFVKFKRITA